MTSPRRSARARVIILTMEITIDEAGRTLLQDVLDAAYHDIKFKIADTDNSTVRSKLSSSGSDTFIIEMPHTRSRDGRPCHPVLRPTHPYCSHPG